MRPIPPSLLKEVQRTAPPTVPARRLLTLPIEKLHPIVRIARIGTGPLIIPARIILDHELVLITAGTGTIVVGDKVMAYQPFDILFIPPFVPHAFTAQANSGSHIAIHFDLAPDFPPGSHLMARRPYEVRFTSGLTCSAHTSLSRGHHLIRHFEAAVEAWDENTPLSPLQMTTHVLPILMHLLREAPQYPAMERTRVRLDRVSAYIDHHLANPHTVESLAKIADMSASHFAAVFKKHVGHPPLEHIRRQRINHARRLLANVDLSIKEIAQQVGFPDAYHFSRVFRQLDGLSPSHYRAALLASTKS